jgi:integration host factor subunit beta
MLELARRGMSPRVLERDAERAALRRNPYLTPASLRTYSAQVRLLARVADHLDRIEREAANGNGHERRSLRLAAQTAARHGLWVEADSMTRADLVADLAATNPPLRQADVELIVQAVFGDITDALVRGQRVELRGFGVFTARRHGARVGCNPGTGETVPVDAKAVPFFKAGRELHGRLNGGRIARQGRP